MARQKLFSVTIDDCEVETFTVGGNGGAGKDTSNTGVRIRHLPSGAVGTAREARSQVANKRTAFGRMARSKEFMAWSRLLASRMGGRKTPEQLTDEAMEPQNLKVETRDSNGRWTEAI